MSDERKVTVTELKLTIPVAMLWLLIGVIFFQGVSNLILTKQRYDGDMAFMDKVKEIQAENQKLRTEMKMCAGQ